MQAVDYHSCVELLKDRQNRIIGNNTRINMDKEGKVVVHYFGNEIVKIEKNGDVWITLAGYPTISTKTRINQFIGNRTVYTKNKVTYLDGMKMELREWYLVKKVDMH